MDKRLCDKYNQDYSNGELSHGRPIHIDADIVANWYPKSFAEKIDQILLYIFNHAPHLGQSARFSVEQLYSFLFVDRYEFSPESGKYVYRTETAFKPEMIFMLKCLEEQEYIRTTAK